MDDELKQGLALLLLFTVTMGPLIFFTYKMTGFKGIRSLFTEKFDDDEPERP